jgi:uncharacterized protein YjbI with pentapeptide repeats
MSPFTITFVGFLIVILSVVPGLYLWFPSRRDSAARSDLGVALMTGALIAFAVLTIQVLIERNIRERDAARQRADARQNLQLTLSFTKDLTAIKLDGRDLRGFHLYNKTLHNAVLDDADLRKATLSRSDLSNAMLRRAKLNEASMNDAVLQFAKMEKANLDLAILTNAKMAGAVLVGSSLVQTDFETADLRGVDFRGANLRRASLAGTNLIGADMTDASVDLETSFAEAIYDATTKFPQGVVQDPCKRKECIAH